MNQNSKIFFKQITSSKTALFFALVFIANLLIRLWAILFLQGHASGLSTPPQQLLQVLGESDAGSYLRLALDLLDLKIKEENRWILLLWPPGMVSLNVASLISPFGYIFTFSALSAAIWTIPSLALYQSASDFTQKKARIVLVSLSLLIIVFPFTFNYAITQGFHNSDIVGVALLSAGFVYVFRSFNASSKTTRNQFFLAGALIGGSLYFRWANFPILLFIFAYLILVFFNNSNSRFNRGLVSRGLALALSPIKSLSALRILIGIVIVTTPWTLVSMFILHPTDHSPLWSVSDWIWGYRWLLDTDLEKAGGQWLLDSGTNWACNISRTEVCLEYRQMAQSQDSQYFETLRNSALSAAIQNPAPFVSERLQHLSLFWFNSLGSAASAVHNAALGISAIASFVFCIVMALFSPKKYLAQSIFSLVPASLVFASLLFLHYEGRYLFPIFVLLWLGALYIFINYLRDQDKLSPATKPIQGEK